VNIKVAHLLAGGYDRRAREIPKATRTAVKDRGRVCVQCRAPGEEIDHIDSPSSDPEDLQFLCKDCHHAKTATNLVPASPEKRVSSTGFSWRG
jgi:5-methylcytosine-specific restriction endonuclease McrA